MLVFLLIPALGGRRFKEQKFRIVVVAAATAIVVAERRRWWRR